MLRDIKIDLEYQPLIEGPPSKNLYQQACNGDQNTVDHWRDTWIKNYKAGKDHFGDLGSKSFGQLHGANRHKAAICVGSGPSLKYSLEALKKNASGPHPVLTVSCLHNFGYFEDEGFHADYYVSLDAGPIVLKDISETCKHDSDYYWEKTKDKTLIAYASSDPQLWEKWQGKIYLFSCRIPDLTVMEEYKKIEEFNHFISSGGNCLGGCMYIAKCVMGSGAIMYVGADFCFDYDNTFHSYKTQYDNPGIYVNAVDVYGNRRKTWQSYLNFKWWTDHIACTIPGIWINCSEGILGAYRDGNIKQFVYQSLKDALLPYQSADTLFLQDRNAKGEVQGFQSFSLSEFWADPKNEKKITFF